MSPTKTPFAQLERLAAGDPFSSDGYAFQDIDRKTIDRILRVGAVTHIHDAHPALADPTFSPVLTSATTGGAIAAATALFVTYTLLDVDGGETAPAPVQTITTDQGYSTPFDAPGAVVDYVAGTLLSGNYSYAATVTDSLGGETEISPAAVAVVNPGFAHGEVTISGLQQLVNDASNFDVLASWRLWRSQGGGPWYLIGTGTTDTFLDNGIAGDCTVAPPDIGTTKGANTLGVMVPGGQPATAVSFNIYGSLDGAFTNPALLGTFAIAQTGVVQTFTDLTVQSGSPPALSTTLPGANLIDPDTDLVGNSWKRPVANQAALPNAGNTDGDVRVTLDTGFIWEWSTAKNAWGEWNPIGDVVNESQVTGTSYQLALADAGTVIEFVNGAASTLTIPLNANVPFPVGTIIEIFQYGAGQVTVVGAGGVTLRSYTGLVHTAGQYASIALRQRAVDEWVISGNLA